MGERERKREREIEMERGKEERKGGKEKESILGFSFRLQYHTILSRKNYLPNMYLYI